MGGRRSVGAEKQPFERVRWNGNLPRWLMAQRQDFDGKIVPALEERKRVCQNDPESGQHNSLRLSANPRQSVISQPDRLPATLT